MLLFVDKSVQVGPSVQAVWGIGLDRLDAEILGLNPTYSMDVCLSVLCCPV
jgi:hypothetical protein